MMLLKNSNDTLGLNAMESTKSRKELAKAIILLGIPLIVGELGSVVQQFADTMMVGHYGTNELAAAGFVNSIFYFVIFLTLGVSYASTPLVGSAYGRKDYKGVFRILIESLIVNFLVGLFFVILLLLIYFNMETWFFSQDSAHFHQPYEILDLSKQYMMMLIISIPFMTLFYACKQYLDGIGNTKVSMWVMLFANILNIVLNWCMIFGHCGFEPMGLQGAGLSTLISRIVQFAMILVVVFKTRIVKDAMDVIKDDPQLMPTKAGVVEQLRLGWPISVQLGLEIGVFNVCGIFMGWLGALPLAAHQTMYTISTLCFQVLYGIGAAGTILISQFFGVKAWGDIRKTASTAFFVGLLAVVLLTLCIVVFFKPLAACFTEDQEVVKLMWLILPSFIFYQLGDCTQIMFANALRGIEDTKPLAFIASFAYIAVCIPLCYVMSFVLDLGVSGVWMGIPIGLSLAGILFFIRFRRSMRALQNK